MDDTEIRFFFRRKACFLADVLKEQGVAGHCPMKAIWPRAIAAVCAPTCGANSHHGEVRCEKSIPTGIPRLDPLSARWSGLGSRKQ